MSTPAEARAATEARLAALRAEAQAQSSAHHPSYHEDHHEMRQRFRRLVDPGIMKHNDKKASYAAFDTLLKLSDNLLKDPENPKYHSFKTTNKLIKTTLLDVTGGLEYAVELGFRLDVQDLQPVYVFHPTEARLVSLRVGAEVIREAVRIKEEKEERDAETAKAAKAAKDAAVKKAMQAYEEDRQTVRRRAQREEALRRAAGTPTSPVAPAPHSSTSTTPQPAPHTPLVLPHSNHLTPPGPDVAAQDQPDVPGVGRGGPPGRVLRGGFRARIFPGAGPRGRGSRFPGGGRSISQPEGADMEVDDDEDDPDYTLGEGEEDEEGEEGEDGEEMPPPYGMHAMPGGGGRGARFGGEGRRLGD